MGEHVAETLAALAAQELAQVKAERDRLHGGLKAAIEHWTKKREVNQRDGDRRASIVYGAVVERALEVLNGEDVEEPAALASAEKAAQLQAVLDAPRWDELTPAERTDVIARQVSSSLRLSGHETTPEQIKGHLASTGSGMHVISLEHDEESSQRGMREAAERVARSVVKGKGGG